MNPSITTPDVTPAASGSTGSTLKKELFPGISVATLLLFVLMLFSLAIHLYNIRAIGDANAYYTAAVKSMLQSWHNFFFVAAEPGGSVTVDKPPLGLWIEAVFAYFLGVSGFSVSLPNILAGVLGLPLLYHLVRKHMGELAGLVAALVMTLTPVFVATNRNNTMDGLLVFFLLLAAWAFIRASETGKARWLLLGALITGLGFNIKMLQAFLPLPAFYALYFFGSKESWWRKLTNLVFATVLLAAVSLSWAIAVDLTPADQRPYIGSSGDNSVIGLIFGHNGGSRLFGRTSPGNDQQTGNAIPGAASPGSNPPAGGPQTQPNDGPTYPRQPVQRNPQGPPPQALAACTGLAQGAACAFTQPNGNSIRGACIIPLNSDQLACVPSGGVPNGQLPPNQSGNNANPQVPPYDDGPTGAAGGAPFSHETGSPGVLRFFTQPLSRQMSWLLPFALLAGGLALFGARLTLPLSAGVHKALVIWGGWLLTCLVFFSAISGIFHAYYAIMLAPALGAVVGIGFAQFWAWDKKQPWASLGLGVCALLTVAFQAFATLQYGERSAWLLAAFGMLLAGGLLQIFRRRVATRSWSAVVLLAAMLVIPLYWTGKTVTTSPNQNLPTAYTGANQPQNALQGIPGDIAGQDGPNTRANTSQLLLDYLLENTQDVEYMLAVPSSQQGATLVLASGRPVLYMGGFGGGDNVVSAQDLAQMVAVGKLRYVLYGGGQGSQQEIASWLQNSCTVLPEFDNIEPGNRPTGASGQPGGPPATGPGMQANHLYRCD